MGGQRSSNGCSVSCLLSTHVAVLMLAVGHSLAADSLRKGDSLKDGETLVSQGKVFELGFFGASESSSRYLGIWYKNISEFTVVWVANRDKRITDTSGEFTINDVGDLMLLDGRGSLIWQAGTPAVQSSVARLLDDGNLILTGKTSNTTHVFWQSFDNPTDTLLPGMRLGFKGKRNQLLASWRSKDDPSQGDFEIGVDPAGTKQLFIWQNGAEYWSTGRWNGRSFSLIDADYMFPILRFTFVSDSNKTYFTYSATGIISRYVLGFDGQIKHLVWDSRQGWMVFWVEPQRYPCDSLYFCGENGLCSNNSQAPCKCLPGFDPDSSRDWQAGDRSGGCVRRNRLTCGDSDGFLLLRRVKRPFSMLNSSFINESKLGTAQCGALCKANCACTAYSSADKDGTGCSLWFGKLMGLQENYGDGQDFYLRLASVDLNTSAGAAGGSKWVLPVLFSSVAAVLILMVCFSVCCWRRLKRKDPGEVAQNQELLLLEIGPLEYGKCQQFSLHSFAEVVAATDDFSDENKLGEGGFGPVYKGIFPGDLEIAVKRLSSRSTQGLEEFKTEILLIAKLQHRNLVRLLGCCIKGEERMLVYEYMPNKSLDFFLFDPERAVQLDWSKRLNIIEGIAQGLLYLHKHSRLTVIHRDLKASNILLDSKMNPKISDFGMARIFSNNDSEANTNRVVGTIGYMSPEYAMEGLFSTKSDVFSFGVLLLEILCGKRNTAACHPPSTPNLFEHAWKLWSEGRELELMDPSLGTSYSREEASRCIHVALLCAQESPASRPETSDIVAALGTEKTTSLPVPKQPSLFSRTLAVQENPSPGQPVTGSLNFMTISTVGGR